MKNDRMVAIAVAIVTLVIVLAINWHKDGQRLEAEWRAVNQDQVEVIEVVTTEVTTAETTEPLVIAVPVRPTELASVGQLRIIY
jgi:uncharacterized protein YoxC